MSDKIVKLIFLLSILAVVMRGQGRMPLRDLRQSGATTGQCAVWNGTIWAPADCVAGAGAITTLNGLTAATQTFATGTAGTDFGISSVTSTHTFNIPSASATVRGLLTSADWSTFNSKESALTFSSPLVRTVNTVACATCEITTAKNSASGYAGLTAGTKLTTSQGQEVWALADLTDLTGTSGSGSTAILSTITTPAAGQYLRWNGSNWINAAINFTDLAGTLAAGQMLALAGDLSGTTGSASVTVVKVNGVNFPTSPSVHQVPIVTSANQVTYKTIPDCDDTVGQHLNFDQSTDTWSCGTTGVTFADKIPMQVAKCQNVTASTNFSLPAAGAPTAACATGTNVNMGVLQFADAASASFQDHITLPTGWTGAVDLALKWRSAAIAGSVVWQIQTICVADAETFDPAFNTASTVVDATKGTTLQLNDASITGITTTGCAVGEEMFFKLTRDPAHASDNLGDTAELIGLEWTIRRTQ